MIWLVGGLDLALSKKATALAIYSVVVIRFPNGIFDSISFNFSFGFGNVLIHFSYNGVNDSATTTAFTRMPYFNNSTAHSLVIALRPPLAAAYADVLPSPLSAVFVVIFTI